MAQEELKKEEQPVSMAFDVYMELSKSNQAVRDINDKLIKAIKTIVIAFLLAIALIAGGFLWYLSLPIDDYVVTQDTDTGGNNYNIGGNYNGEADNPQETESGAQ